MRLDKDSPVTYKPKNTLKALDERFEGESFTKVDA